MRIHDVGVARQIGPCSDAIERSPGSRMLLVTYRTRSACSRKQYAAQSGEDLLDEDLPARRQCLGYPGLYRSARMRARARAPNLDVVLLTCTCSATLPNGVKAIAADAPLG
jgi:hypothetical protein